MKHPTLLLFDSVKEEYDWLSPELCGELYDLCKDDLFENADGIKFYLWLNLRAKTPLVPKARAKSQIKYLVHRLSGLINFDKVPERDIDISVSDTYKDLSDDFGKGVLRGLTDTERKRLLTRTWEKKAIEKCGISYEDMAKHHTAFAQGLADDKSYRAVKKKEFISRLDRIIGKYASQS